MIGRCIGMGVGAMYEWSSAGRCSIVGWLVGLENLASGRHACRKEAVSWCRPMRAFLLKILMPRSAQKPPFAFRTTFGPGKEISP